MSTNGYRGALSVIYRSAPSRTVDIDVLSRLRVDSPRAVPTPEQSRDTREFTGAEVSRLALVRHSAASYTLTIGHDDNGDDIATKLPVDAKSMLVVEGPGRTAAAADFVNRIVTKLPLAGASSIVFERAA